MLPIRKPAYYQQKVKYGLYWSNSERDIDIEIEMVRGGGYMQVGRQKFGNGLAYHMRAFQEILWPEKEWHAWAILELECFCKYTYIGEMGCAAAGKTFGAGTNHLADWYCFPDCTTVLVSSTDLRSLDMRAWGTIKQFHRLAKRRFPDIPGHLIEGRRVLIHDPKDEAAEGRDFKNGLVAVPCRHGETFIGLGCFPSGTLVDTPNGQSPIETIKAGDSVVSAVGVRKVKRCSTRISNFLLRITMKDGRVIDCTPNHPFFTSKGWVRAIDISGDTYILSQHETLQIMRKSDSGPWQNPILLTPLSRQGENENVSALPKEVLANGFSERMLWKILHDEAENVGQGFCGSDKVEDRLEVGSREGKIVHFEKSKGVGQKKEDDEGSCWRVPIKGGKEKLEAAARKGRQSVRESWQWTTPITGGIGFVSSFPGGDIQFRCEDQQKALGQGRVALCETGFSVARPKALSGSGRRDPLSSKTENPGCEERHLTQGAWVDSVEVLQRAGDERYLESEGGYRVHNLEVEGHPSYCVRGLVSHNSYVGIHNKRVKLLADELHLMARAFLDSTSNLSKCEEFKMTGIGNPNDTTNAHGVLCEPSPEIGGWESGIDQGNKTTTWETRFPNGICIQLPGSDSPNMVAAPDQPPPYPYLMTRQQMEDDAQIWGITDWHYTMMNEARMPRGQGTRRFITRQMCLKFGAQDEPDWLNSNRTRIACLDAAYRGVGGDRCVFMELQFGAENEAINAEKVASNLIFRAKTGPKYRQILALVDTQIVPIKAEQDSDLPEDQIVRYVMDQCRIKGIPPENFFFDAGMRTSLVTAFSRVWSPQVNSIDFGGKPTERNVSGDIQIPAKDYYSKFVTELWFSLRLVIEARQFRGLTVDVMNEGCQREWKNTAGNKIEAETKEEMKLKTGRSPDLVDCLVCGIEGARRRGFVIQRLAAEKRKTLNDDWKRELQKRSDNLWRSKELNYS